MAEPRRRGNKYWYPLHSNPLGRVLKFRNILNYLDMVPSHGTVLDYGSGDRPLEDLLTTRFDRYIAADYDVTNELHGRRQPDIHIIDSRVDLPTASVDCIILTEVLEHIYKPHEALTELQRILKPGGTIIGSVPFAVAQHEIPYDFHRYTYFCLERMFNDNGFIIKRLEYVGDLLAVMTTTFTSVLGIGPKGLRRARLAILATPLAWLIKLPEYLYLALNRSPLSPQKAAYFRRFPLGFTFMLEK